MFWRFQQTRTWHNIVIILLSLNIAGSTWNAIRIEQVAERNQERTELVRKVGTKRADNVCASVSNINVTLGSLLSDLSDGAAGPVNEPLRDRFALALSELARFDADCNLAEKLGSE